MKTDYDVVVFGGGTAGIPAAIQAARAGARTLLVERNAMLGGTMTLGGVNYPAHFFAWGKRIIGGIGWELFCRTCSEGGQPIPEPEAGSRHLPLDACLFAVLADEALLEAGVEPLFHAMPAAAAWDGEAWRLQVCTKQGLRPVQARVVIDATGDANVVGLAGLPLVRHETVQPASLKFLCSGYDFEALDQAALNAAAAAAVDAGELRSTDLAWHGTSPVALLRRGGGGVNHLRAPRAETSEGRTQVEIEGRRSVLRLYRFLRRQPGLERFRIDGVWPETGIRETVTIRGKTTVTVTDYESGRRFDDAICYAFYPIDEHLNDGLGINQRALASGVLPTIPRGALLPEGSRFLLAAGRCLSSDREANSALRVECPCLAMGQAAGAMAALSARTGVDPELLPFDDVRELLHRHGAIVPGKEAP